MKIQLPNPDEYLHNEDEFWEQLDLAIYHAKKSWEKIKKRYDEADAKVENYPWLAFRHELKIENALDDAKDKDGNYIDDGYKERQEINISIEEL